MSATELDEQGVNSANLHSMAAAGVACLCRVDMVLAIRLDERQRSETVDDAVARHRAGKALQKFLKHKPSTEDLVGS